MSPRAVLLAEKMADQRATKGKIHTDLIVGQSCTENPRVPAGRAIKNSRLHPLKNALTFSPMV